MDPTVLALFFFYLAFMLLAVLNIITGVFVDNAVETARTQRDWMIQKETELREKYIQEMRSIFAELDDDGSETITMEELQVGLSDERMQSYFLACGLGLDDTARLFALIDDDASGEVDVDEFLEGCLRLKGTARSIDVHQIIHECRKITGVVNDILSVMPERPAGVLPSKMASPGCSSLQT